MLRRLGRGRRGQREGRCRPVVRRDPPQAPQHRADVRPEDPPINVTLVDDDVVETAPEVRPRRMRRQYPRVQHVGVGQHDPRVSSDPASLVQRRVPVVRRDAHPGHAERRDPRGLVGGQRLRRAEVERGRAPQGALTRRQRGQRGQDRQQVAQALARGRAGRQHDVSARRQGLRGLRLMAPQRVDPRGLEPSAHDRRHPRRVGGLDGAAPRKRLDVGHAGVPRCGEHVAQQLLRPGGEGRGRERGGERGIGHRRHRRTDHRQGCGAAGCPPGSVTGRTGPGGQPPGSGPWAVAPGRPHPPDPGSIQWARSCLREEPPGGTIADLHERGAGHPRRRPR